MGALWNRVLGLSQSDEDSAPPQDAVAAVALVAAASQRYSPQTSLEAIGMHNEALRAQLEEVQHGLEQLDQMKGLFHGLLAPISELMTEFEAAKARLIETKTRLSVVEEARETLNARHAATMEECDLIAEARNALLRENRETGQRVQRLDAALSQAQGELREGLAANEKLERLLGVETRRNAAFADELRRLREELSSKDLRLANLETALKTANDQGALLSQENAGLRESSESLASELGAVNRRAAEHESRVAACESLVEQGKHRIAALEQSLAEEQAAHADLRATHLEHIERSRAEASRLGDAIVAARGRADLTNRILDQTRGQLREKIEELRVAERRLLENGIQIDALEKSERALRDDLAGANERLAGAERVRRTLADQANGLSEELRAKEAALQSAVRAIEQLTARAEEAAKGRRQAKQEMERRIAALQNEIARICAERRLVDGALEASRTERRQTRRAAPAIAATAEKPREAMAELDEAPPTPPPDNVAKLPLADAQQLAAAQ